MIVKLGNVIKVIATPLEIYKSLKNSTYSL